jgi:hypothetical protein
VGTFEANDDELVGFTKRRDLCFLLYSNLAEVSLLLLLVDDCFATFLIGAHILPVLLLVVGTEGAVLWVKIETLVDEDVTLSSFFGCEFVPVKQS